MKHLVCFSLMLLSGQLYGQQLQAETPALHFDDLKFIYEHTFNESIVFLAKKKGQWSVDGSDTLHMWTTNSGYRLSIGQAIKGPSNSFVTLFLNQAPTFSSIGSVILDEVYKSNMKQEVVSNTTTLFFYDDKYKIAFQESKKNVVITFARKEYFVLNPHK
ncbi:MAG: hypothetical protein IM613_17450 [Cytophagales bacterium]|nr:hypothetical protein [Cytophagales bacterium]